MEILYHGRQVENNPVHLKRLEIVCNPLCYFSQSGRKFYDIRWHCGIETDKEGPVQPFCIMLEYDTERPTQPSCIILNMTEENSDGSM